MHSKFKWLYPAILSLILAILGLVHQKFFTSGGWFNWEQFWHHEPLIAIAFVVSIIILVIYLYRRSRIKKREEAK